MTPEPWVVAERWSETRDTFSLALEPPSASWSFRPGQFNMLYAFGRGESAISISGDPGDSNRIIHTIRRVGAVTRALGELKPGDMVGVRGPFGTSWPVEEARGRDLVLVAGGIGLAPLRPAALAALAQREQFGRVVLLLGARTPSDILFSGQLDEWRERMEVIVTVDQALLEWKGHVGVVTTRIGPARLDPARTVALICGPEIMMRFTVAELRQLGIPGERIFVSMERNMKCAIGFCGHCQYGPEFICKDGPVFRHDRVARWFNLREF